MYRASCHCVLRNVRSTLTSTNQRMPCACHDFATLCTSTHTRTADFLHRATNSRGLTCRPSDVPCAPFTTLATRNARCLQRQIIRCPTPAPRNAPCAHAKRHARDTLNCTAQHPQANMPRTRCGRSRTSGTHAAKTGQTRSRPQTPT